MVEGDLMIDFFVNVICLFVLTSLTLFFGLLVISMLFSVFGEGFILISIIILLVSIVGAAIMRN